MDLPRLIQHVGVLEGLHPSESLEAYIQAEAKWTMEEKAYQRNLLS